MITSKPAETENRLLDVIRNRWSPHSFEDKPFEKEKIISLLEAARWAPSSFNEQPWSYVIGLKGDETFNKLSDCLFEGNSWAKNASVLMLSIAHKFFKHNDKLNVHYLHDTGAASGYLALQATDMDLVAHQMAGFDIDKVRELFNIGDEYEPASMIAIGYQGDADTLSDDLKERERSPRTRKEISEMIWKTE